MTQISYLAPELPALSATFIYEELLGLEERGFRVLPISIRRPSAAAVGQEELAGRTLYLYESGYLRNMLAGLLLLPRFGKGLLLALRWLCSDMLECGIFRLNTWKLLYQFLVSARIAVKLLESNCKHLHIHFAHVPAQVGMYASAMSNVPFTIMAHANDIFERGLLLKAKARRAKKFITISEFNRAYLIDLGIPAEKLAVVRCGVSFDPYQYGPLQFKKRVLRIGTLGRLVEKKGVDVLIGAIDSLAQDSYSLCLSIVGDGPMKAFLAQLVAEMGLSDRVKFEGSMRHSEVAEWMRGLDVFVLACKKDTQGDMDGIPVVLMEAMSQGVPVISSNLSGIPELVKHGQTGLLADPGNSQDLARQIASLVANAELVERMRAAAQRHVQYEFGFESNLDRLVECFDIREN
jgi:glycosyltransferase involved in cell wall biosynthesis